MRVRNIKHMDIKFYRDTKFDMRSMWETFRGDFEKITKVYPQIMDIVMVEQL